MYYNPYPKEVLAPKLPMGVCNIPEIFQGKISELFEGFYRVRADVVKILIITKYDLIKYVKALEKLLQKPAEEGLKIKTEELYFKQTETDYFGFWVSNNKLMSLLYKYTPLRQFKDQPKYATYTVWW